MSNHETQVRMMELKMSKPSQQSVAQQHQQQIHHAQPEHESLTDLRRRLALQSMSETRHTVVGGGGAGGCTTSSCVGGCASGGGCCGGGGGGGSGSGVAGRFPLLFAPHESEIPMDSMSDEEIIEARHGASVYDLLRSNANMMLKWPHRMIDHARTVTFPVEFMLEKQPLSTLIETGKSGGAYGVIRIPLSLDNLREHFRVAGNEWLRVAGNDFVPHRIAIDKYTCVGAHADFFAKLVSTDVHTNKVVPWLTTKTVNTLANHPIKSAPLRLEDGLRAHRVGRYMFHADEYTVSKATWRRWATQSHTDILADLKKFKLGALYYEFRVTDPESTYALHPVLHAAMLNLSQLLSDARTTDPVLYSALTIDDMVSIDNDGSIVFKLPQSSVHYMIKCIFDDVQLGHTLMHLSSAAIELVPDVSWEELERLHVTRHSNITSPAVWNPVVKISVTVLFEGAMVPV